MNYNNIYLGIRDIFKNFKNILLLIIILSLISQPIVKSIDSLIINLTEEKKLVNYSREYNLELVPISFEDIDQNLKEDVNEFFENNEITSFNSGYFSEKVGQYVYFFDGRSDQKYNNKSYILSDRSIENAVLNEVNDDNIKNNIYDILNDLGYGFNFNVYEIISDDEIDNVYKYIDKSELVGIVSNLDISNVETINKLEKVFNNSFAKLKIVKSEKTDENDFLFKYIFVYNFLNILLVIFVINYFYKELFNNLRKEHKIHYIHGARIKDIFIRNIVHIILIVLSFFMIFLFLNAFNKNIIAHVIKTISIFYLVIFLINNIVFCKKLSKSILS
ncbi:MULTISPECIES: hypothetical protein [Helcococcus]|uniref:DUF1430 domain-containing protein n=1 Tax=Helcococcus bovis TaxID=3153252 RepID=A0ABW9F5Z3_9FIRM